MPRYILVQADESPVWTDNPQVAEAAKESDDCLVIDTRKLEYTFDGESESIDEADPADWLGTSEGEGDNE